MVTTYGLPRFQSGLEVGEMPIDVTAIDAFDATDSAEANITVLNQVPRLTEIENVPSIVQRGDKFWLTLRFSMAMEYPMFDRHERLWWRPS